MTIRIDRSLFVTPLLIAALVAGCDDDTSSANHEDISEAELFDMATDKEDHNWSWFMYSDDTLESARASGHVEPLVRTRYNSTARDHLNDNGRVEEGITFNNGALIVKELYTEEGELSSIAVMLKSASHEYSGDNDWVWGYYNPDGSVKKTITDMGDGCRSCHSSGVDYTMMNAGH